MNQAFETELRGALAERARQVPTEAARRLSAADYRPRAVPDPRLAMGAATAVVAGGTAAALVAVGGGTSPAFAGWTAKPSAPAAGQVSTANVACTARLAVLGAPPAGRQPASHAGVETRAGVQRAVHRGVRPAGPRFPSGAWSPVLTDTRGPFTATILSNGGARATCLTGPSFTTITAATAPGGNSTVIASGSTVLGEQSGSDNPPQPMSVMTPAGAGNGPILSAFQGHLTTSDGQPYTFLQGQVTGTASALTIARSSGPDVQASVADGSFVAWWPDNAGAISGQITTAAGTATQQIVFNLPGKVPAPPPGSSSAQGEG